MSKNGIPVAATELGKTDFLAKSLEELRTIDNRFHNPQRSKTILETINSNNGEWPENRPTMSILDELLEIEKFLSIVKNLMNSYNRKYGKLSNFRERFLVGNQRLTK